MAACSDGKDYANAKAFRKHEQRLAKAQRSLSRKVKFSNNWHKTSVKSLRHNTLTHRFYLVGVSIY